MPDHDKTPGNLHDLQMQRIAKLKAELSEAQTERRRCSEAYEGARIKAEKLGAENQAFKDSAEALGVGDMIGMAFDLSTATLKNTKLRAVVDAWEGWHSITGLVGRVQSANYHDEQWQRVLAARKALDPKESPDA